MKNKLLIGIDIGGTKCAVVLGEKDDDKIKIIEKIKFPTESFPITLKKIFSNMEQIITNNATNTKNIDAVGISCGGPLDSTKGMICSPPNLPGWDNIPIVKLIEDRFGLPAYLQNDANASTLAEWKYGAGRSAKNMIFLTFGTGMGAGLILNGRLYEGTNGNAGEVGHIRLTGYGPFGYGKAGSFEGFCSGGGIRQIAQIKIKEAAQKGGVKDSILLSIDDDQLTAEIVAKTAFEGDDLAIEIFQVSAHYLGMGLSILIDILNPEVIVIGSIYTRSKTLFQKNMLEVIENEALPQSRKVCQILRSELGDEIGDYAALSVADINSE